MIMINLMENWYVIIGIIVLIIALAYAGYRFFKLPTNKQLEKVKEWLVLAVVQAEKELGSGTGQIKLRFVYDLFITRFKWISRIISFRTFTLLVDEALERMRDMLESNVAVKELVVSEKDKNVQ
jgi:uncharacterized membrane protein